VISNICVVLVATTHPGNIGSSARAMKNMGLSDLILVNPKCAIDQMAITKSAGADDVLLNAKIVTSLEQALSDCALSFAISARKRSLNWQQVTAKECANYAVQNSKIGNKVALVFGREHAGLTNSELQQCKYQVCINANPKFSSLNLAAAVQIISYEIYGQLHNNNVEVTNKPAHLTITHADLEGFYQHLEQVLMQINFLPKDNQRHLMARLRKLYAKADLDRVELNILRGILTKTAQAVKNNDSGKQLEN